WWRSVTCTTAADPAPSARSGARSQSAGCRRRWPDSRRSCYSLLRRRSVRLVFERSSKAHKEPGDGTRTRGRKGNTKPEAPARAAEIVREYGPFAGADQIHVTHDGRRVWVATGSTLVAFAPESGQLARTLGCAGDAGTSFDGTHQCQIAEARIDKIDPATGDVVASIPAPGCGGGSGLPGARGSRG